MPPEMTISLAEYDAYRSAAYEAWDAHVILRKLKPLVMGELLTDNERNELIQEFQHFEVAYLHREG